MLLDQLCTCRNFATAATAAGFCSSQMRSNFFALAPKCLRMLRNGASFLHAQDSVLHGRRLNLLQWQGRSAAAAPDAAGKAAEATVSAKAPALHELCCYTSAQNSGSCSSSSSSTKVLRMQGLVGAEFAADCEEIIPRAKEVLDRWKQAQKLQQHQQKEEKAEVETQEGIHEGEEQFYAQVSSELRTWSSGFRMQSAESYAWLAFSWDVPAGAARSAAAKRGTCEGNRCQRQATGSSRIWTLPTSTRLCVESA